MKYTLLFIAIIICSCNETTVKSDVASKENRIIKTKTEWIYTIVNPTHGFKNSVETYDKSGRVLTFEVFSVDRSGKLADKTTYKYSGDKLVEELIEDFENKRETKYFFDYNLQGQQIRQRYRSIDKNDMWDSLVNKFNDKGNITKSISYVNGDSVFDIDFKYNDQNELTQKNINDPFRPSEYIYKHENELLIEEKEFLKDKSFESKTTYTYDEQKKLVKEVKYMGDNPNPAWTLEFKYEYYD